MNEKMKSSIEIAAATFMRNPYWRRYYETAPSEACREYISMQFCYSIYIEYLSDQEIHQRICELEDGFSLADWKHLYNHTGNNPEKYRIKKRIQELTGTL